MQEDFLLARLGMIDGQLRGHDLYRWGSAPPVIALRGLSSEARSLVESAYRARKSVRKGPAGGIGIHVGDIAVHAKGMADNLNHFLQMTYAGIRTPDLRALDRNIRGVSSRSTDIADRFLETHPDPFVTSVRNTRSHGNGHMIVRNHGTDAMVSVDAGERNAREWVTSTPREYLRMAIDCLSLVVEDVYELEEAPPRTSRVSHGLDIMWRVARIKTERHKRGAVMALAGAALATGVVAGIAGTLVYQDHQRSLERIEQEEALRMMTERLLVVQTGNPGVYRPVDNWERLAANCKVMDLQCREMERTLSFGLARPNPNDAELLDLMQKCKDHYRSSLHYE